MSDLKDTLQAEKDDADKSLQDKHARLIGKTSSPQPVH